VGRRWEAARYARELDAELAAGAAPPTPEQVRAREHYVGEHERRLGSDERSTPALFVLVSLREPERDIASYLSRAGEQHPRHWLSAVSSALTMRDERMLKVTELEAARVRADATHARLADFLPVRPARGVELQWLVRRAFCRALGEPEVDGLHEPRALLFERNGEAVLAPLEADLLRWTNARVEHRGRSLRVVSGLG